MRGFSRLSLLTIFLVAIFLGTGSSQSYAGEPPAGASEAEIDELVTRTMEIFSVPGIAVGIIKDGALVFAKGYGVRELGKPGLITAKTNFGIASNTKAFTTTALAILVDEGKISWDDRVVDILPQFQLADPYVTREFTIRDLLTHRSGLGLGAGDLMIWPETDFSREDIIARLKFLKPVTSFRSVYAYDNLLYIVAGEIIPAVTGKKWEDFVQERILNPLGMNACSTLRSSLPDRDDLAVPHAVVEGELRTVTPDEVSTAAAAGGIICNIQDLSKWVILQLEGGRMADGTPLFSEARQREMWSPQTILPTSDTALRLNRTHFRSYGLGWGLEDYHGYKRVSHSGGLPGMVSYTTMIPELGLGVLVLTNQQSGAAFSAIYTHILKAYVGELGRDWIDYYASIVADQEARLLAIEASAADAVTTGATQPSLSLTEYAGTYRDKWRGDVWISEKEGKLSLKFSRTESLEGVMEHYQYDTFIVRWNDRSLFADSYVRFRLDYEGGIEEMTMKAVSPRTDFSYDFHDLSFEKVAD